MKIKKKQSIECGATLVEVAMSLLPFMLILIFGFSALITVVRVAEAERGVIKVVRNAGQGVYVNSDTGKMDYAKLYQGIKDEMGLNGINDSKIKVLLYSDTQSIKGLPAQTLKKGSSPSDIILAGDVFTVKVNYPLPIALNITTFNMTTAAISRFEPTLQTEIIGSGT